MTDSKIGASRSIYYSLSITDDVPDLTEQEREKLEAVMKKAQEFEEEEAHKMRQPVEGQLYKYTNVMKGWQYRWFVLTPDTGMFEYYMLDERKKSRPRGALHLAGGVVAPSEEDNQSFTVSAVCGEIFKLKASDAKERQFWVDRIRTVIEKCPKEEFLGATNMIEEKERLRAQTLRPETDNLQHECHTWHGAVKGDSLQSPFAFCKTSSSSTFHIEDDKAPANPSQVSSKSLILQPDEAPVKPLESLSDIKEAVYKAVACQKTLAKSIEDLPSSGPSLKCSDRKLLLIKATSQATVQSLEQCFLILQRHKQREIMKSSITTVVSSHEHLDKSKTNVKRPG